MESKNITKQVYYHYETTNMASESMTEKLAAAPFRPGAFQKATLKENMGPRLACSLTSIITGRLYSRMKGKYMRRETLYCGDLSSRINADLMAWTSRYFQVDNWRTVHCVHLMEHGGTTVVWPGVLKSSNILAGWDIGRIKLVINQETCMNKICIRILLHLLSYYQQLPNFY